MTEIVEKLGDIDALSSNEIIGRPELVNTRIAFEGSGNILYCEDGVRLSGASISFKRDNALVVLCKNRHAINLGLTVWNDAVCYIGQDVYTNGKLSIVASERKHVIIGDDCLFSFGIWIRTADPHLVYDCATKQRLNPSKSVFVGDHVWIGQSAMVLKGSRIGSGSIVGAGAVVAGKRIPSNTSWGGVPVKEISRGVFFQSDSVHAYAKEQTERSQKSNSGDTWIYSSSSTSIADEVEHRLDGMGSSREKLSYLLDNVRQSSDKNRFAIGETKKPAVAKSNRGFKRSMGKAMRKAARVLRSKGN